MSVSFLIARRLAAAAAATCLMAAAVPARAGVIAVFDPAFGTSIPGLGFKGSINLDVTDACYTLGSGYHATGGGCQITATSAEINYYPFPDANNVLSTVTLGAAAFGPGYVFGAYYDPLTGQLAGLDTNNSSVFGVSVPAPVNYNGSMLLYFQSGFATPVVGVGTDAVAAPVASIPGVGGAYLINCSGRTEQQGACRRGTTDTSNPGRLTFSVVPEPGTISLGLLGIAALAATRRRARDASAGRASGL